MNENEHYILLTNKIVYTMQMSKITTKRQDTNRLMLLFIKKKIAL